MNVLVAILDTLRWDHLAHNGALPVRTPNIDRFAERACRFESAYIGSFPTIPHRTDCFTGKAVFPRYDWKRLGEDEITLPEVLKQAGYRTGFIADTMHMIRTEFHTRFDEYKATWNPPETNPGAKDVPFLVPPRYIRQDGSEYRLHIASMSHFRKESDWFVAQTMTAAADWIQDQSRRQPWLLWVDTFEIHERWHTPQYYVDLYDPDYSGLDLDFPNYNYIDIYKEKEIRRLRAHYAAEVTLTDRWVGHLLDQIDAMNLWDDTMVVLTSDHGMYLGEHRRMGKHTCDAADPWPLYNEVSRIPLLVWIPRLKAQPKVEALAQPADLMATILDACGVAGPAIHGKSWIPLMKDSTESNWPAIFSSKHVGDNTNIDFCPTRLTVTTRDWTLICPEEGLPAELYSQREDMAQQRDMAEAYPELVERLSAMAVEFLRSQGASETYWARYASRRSS